MRYLTDYGSKIDMFIKDRFVSLQLTNTDMIDNHNTFKQYDEAVIVFRKYTNHVGNYFDYQKMRATTLGTFMTWVLLWFALMIEFALIKANMVESDRVYWKAGRITIKSAKTWNRGKYH